MLIKGGIRMIDQYIQQYGKRLYGLCIKLCTNTPFDADDLYQDTWMKVLKNISKYDTSKQFEPWLTKICVNIYRNTLRRIMKGPIFNGFTSKDEKNAAMERVVESKEQDYAYLHDAIDRLPEKLRITIVLFYFRDMDIASVAQVLEIPQGTVKSRLYKARKILKEVLTDETDIRF